MSTLNINLCVSDLKHLLNINLPENWECNAQMEDGGANVLCFENDTYALGYIVTLVSVSNTHSFSINKSWWDKLADAASAFDYEVGSLAEVMTFIQEDISGYF